MLGGSLLSYKNMLAAAFENMAPGGYCEAVEFETWARDQREDPSGYEHFPELKCAPMFQQWQADLNQAGEKIGRRMNVAVHLREWMIEVGFVNVVETVTMVRSTVLRIASAQNESVLMAGSLGPLRTVG